MWYATIFSHMDNQLPSITYRYVPSFSPHQSSMDSFVQVEKVCPPSGSQIAKIILFLLSMCIRELNRHMASYTWPGFSSA